MTEHEDRREALRRLYEAGRIDANAYISAGGDPDVVERAETRKAARPISGSTAALETASRGAMPPILRIVAGLLLVVLAVRIKDRK